MHCARLASLFPFILTLPTIEAIRAMSLHPRGDLPPNFLEACEVNCTVNRREHTVCTVDCPPIFSVYGTGASGISPAPTPVPYPIPEGSNLSAITITETLISIPAYCLPNGPGAPRPNVPLTSFSEAPSLVSAISAAIDSAKSAATNTEAIDTGLPGPTSLPGGGAIPEPAAPVVPGGTVATGGFQVANETSVKYTPGPVPTQVEPVENGQEGQKGGNDVTPMEVSGSGSRVGVVEKIKFYAVCSLAGFVIGIVF